MQLNAYHPTYRTEARLSGGQPDRAICGGCPPISAPSATQPPRADAADEAAARPRSFLPKNKEERRHFTAAYCPACEAEPGQECRTRVGPIARGHYHVERKRTAYARPFRPKRQHGPSPPPRRVARAALTHSSRHADETRRQVVDPDPLAEPPTPWARGVNPKQRTSA